MNEGKKRPKRKDFFGGAWHWDLSQTEQYSIEVTCAHPGLTCNHDISWNNECLPVSVSVSKDP